MNNVLDYAHARPADPILLVRKAPHAQVWSVWASLEGTAAEEIFEGSSEQEALDWIATGHDLLRKSAFAVAIGGKADIA
jgi:hypothetical protein